MKGGGNRCVNRREERKDWVEKKVGDVWNVEAEWKVIKKIDQMGKMEYFQLLEKKKGRLLCLSAF